jgi:cation-transporting ATPase E
VRTTGQIIRANVLTPVNGIIFTLFVLILVAGFPRDALFAGVVISNSVIGVVQEVRARRTLKELELLNAPKATVVRDGDEVELPVSGVVADDLLTAGPGDQIVVDGVVVGHVGLEVDESLLTGESDPVEKELGDPVMSGSFVSTGSVRYLATGVGADSYASRLAEEARVFKLADSELRRGINTILHWLTFIIPPAAALLLIRLLDSDEVDRWQDALQGTVAAAVAMVPDGLVLLTSLAFIAGVIALARKKALAKELASVELLARVDTICLDKTGTITTGEISYGDATPAIGYDTNGVGAALGAMAAADPSPNPTLAAIASAHPTPDGWEASFVLPFSSARKWAAVSFAEHGTWYLGAPELLLPDSDDEMRARVRAEADTGKRVLLLAHAHAEIGDEELVPDRAAAAVVTLEDTVRADAPEILEYFRHQGVQLKVISGDNPATVAAVAERAGIPDAHNSIDARTLPAHDDPEFDEIVERTRVFGRVTPHQKRAMVRSLQAREHVVAMTGDGVNDVLALKDSDMGIAMGAGSAATRAVAQLVLLDNSFATLPTVLDEGRRVINNIERVSNLFITKATYAVLLTVMVGITGSPFPFLPRQLTLIGTFSIGVPGFFLALAANRALVKPGFLTRVLRFSLPAGVIAGLGAGAAYEIARADEVMTLEEARTIATITLLILGLIVLVIVSRPLRPWKVGLAVGMGLGYAVVMWVDVLREYFQLEYLTPDEWGIVAATSVVAGLLIIAAPRVVDRAWPGPGDT